MFDFSDVHDKEGHKQFITQEQKKRTVASLHAILKPFLLRRVKADVETDLPKKREYILYAPLTPVQKELYRKIREGDIQDFLEKKAAERISREKARSQKPPASKGMKRKAGDEDAAPNKSAKSSRSSTPASSARSRRKGFKRSSYAEVSDRAYFKHMADSSESEEIGEEERKEQERADTLSLASKVPAQCPQYSLTRSLGKEVSRKKLQNPIMQLRLVCNSPHHFSRPWADDADPDSSLVTDSGKMSLLDRLVPPLLGAGHKIILFSQFSKQLDLLQDWATVLRDWQVCRIDGSVPVEERNAQIAAFNEDPECRLFLLSTRAGGLGINLTAADTVILFDSDWNPQQDLQAQDRAHRIGQKRPVIVYRLATKGTVEQTLLEKADGKRRLEKLVIQKDKFRSLLRTGDDEDGADDLQRLLATDDFENYDPRGAMLTDDDLRVLMDRSEAAFERAAPGALEGEGGKFRTVETKTGDGGDILGGLI